MSVQRQSGEKEQRQAKPPTAILSLVLKICIFAQKLLLPGNAKNTGVQKGVSV